MLVQRIIPLTLSAVAASLLFWFTIHQLEPTNIYFSQDQALTLTIADAALDGEVPLTGSPSHVRGRHLGPIYNWYLASLWWATDRSIELTFVIDGIFKLFATIPLALTVLILSPRAYRSWGVAAMLWASASGGYPLLFTTQWQNFTLLIPLSWIYLFGLLMILRVQGSVPWFLLWGSIGVQTHFSLIPLVGLLGVVGIVTGRIDRLNVSTDPPPSWIANPLSARLTRCIGYSLLLGIWLAPLCFEFLYGSNLIQVLHGIFGPKDQAGFLSSGDGLLNFFETYLFGAITESALSYFSWTPVLPFLLGASMLAFLGVRRTGARACIFLSCIPVLTLGYLIAVARQPAPSHVYYFSALLPIPLIFIGYLTSWAIESIHRNQNLVVRLLSVLSLGWLLTVWYGSISEHIERFRRGPVPAVASLSHAREFTHLLASRFDTGGANLLHVEARSSQAAMRDAYYFLLGSQYRSAIRYANQMVEVPSMLRPASWLGSTVVVSCPRPVPRHRETLFIDLQRKAADGVVNSFPLTCYGCGACEAWRFTGNAAQ